MEFMLHDALMKFCMDFQNEVFSELFYEVFDEKCMK
jgi:uncharacterized protein YhbP (UPF0306 family)